MLIFINKGLKKTGNVLILLFYFIPFRIKFNQIVHVDKFFFIRDSQLRNIEKMRKLENSLFCNP